MGLGRSHRYRDQELQLCSNCCPKGKPGGKAATNLGRTGPADLTPQCHKKHHLESPVLPPAKGGDLAI